MKLIYEPTGRAREYAALACGLHSRVSILFQYPIQDIRNLAALYRAEQAIEPDGQAKHEL